MWYLPLCRTILGVHHSTRMLWWSSCMVCSRALYRWKCWSPQSQVAWTTPDRTWQNYTCTNSIFSLPTTSRRSLSFRWWWPCKKQTSTRANNNNNRISSDGNTATKGAKQKWKERARKQGIQARKKKSWTKPESWTKGEKASQVRARQGKSTRKAVGRTTCWRETTPPRSCRRKETPPPPLKTRSSCPISCDSHSCISFVPHANIAYFPVCLSLSGYESLLSVRTTTSICATLICATLICTTIVTSPANECSLLYAMPKTDSWAILLLLLDARTVKEEGIDKSAFVYNIQCFMYILRQRTLRKICHKKCHNIFAVTPKSGNFGQFE